MVAESGSVLVGGALNNFFKGFRSEATRYSYLKKLREFLSFSGLSADEVIAIALSDPKRLEGLIGEYVGYLKCRNVSGSTIRQGVQAVKHLLVMNDSETSISWYKLSKLMPPARKVGLDRAPTKEEIRRLLEYADIRMRALILLLVSSGIRIGSVEHLKWKHVEEVVTNGQRFAKLRVPVAKGGDGYITFISPEAYSALLEYRKLRESEGEKISGESPLIRVVKWSKTEAKGEPLPATSKSLRNELHILWHRAGLRNKSDGGAHDVKAVHGFRKFFATRLENAGVGRLVVETLLGHRVSLASNYYKPTEKELMEAYIKAIPEITISEAAEARSEMQKRLIESGVKIAELEKINTALQEKLTQLETEFNTLKTLVNELIAKSRRKKSKRNC